MNETISPNAQFHMQIKVTDIYMCSVYILIVSRLEPSLYKSTNRMDRVLSVWLIF